MSRRDPEKHERMLAGIVERAATNGRGLGIAVPKGEVGGRFEITQQPDQPTAEELTEQAIALDALIHKVAAALAGANMDHAITALVSLVVTYATSKEAGLEIRVATMQRLLMAMEAIDKP